MEGRRLRFADQALWFAKWRINHLQVRQKVSKSTQERALQLLRSWDLRWITLSDAFVELEVLSNECYESKFKWYLTVCCTFDQTNFLIRLSVE